MSNFRAIGLSYLSAPIEIREVVSFEAENEAADLLLKLKDIFGIEEGLLISTCNRTELYYSSKNDVSEEIIKMISSQKGLESDLLSNHFRSYTKAEATNQLFRVSLGLESKVLGDIQISNQVKKAYQLSADLDMAGHICIG